MIEKITFECPNGHLFTVAQAWEADIPCCVHYIDGKQIADFGCPVCRARVREEAL